MPNTTTSPPSTSPPDPSNDADKQPSAPSTQPGDDTPVAPAGGAGVFDVDPDQTDVIQDSEESVTGDIDSFPLDVEP